MSPYEFGRVLVAVDGSDGARKALDCALSICAAVGAELTALAAGERGLELTPDLVPGHAAEVITHYARAHGHDLIVIGHRGHFLGDYLLGSTADRVAHHAHCPVMVVR
jgi:nucleotide-binding universal stress UspA family protein